MCSINNLWVILKVNINSGMQTLLSKNSEFNFLTKIVAVNKSLHRKTNLNVTVNTVHSP